MRVTGYREKTQGVLRVERAGMWARSPNLEKAFFCSGARLLIAASEVEVEYEEIDGDSDEGPDVITLSDRFFYLTYDGILRAIRDPSAPFGLESSQLRRRMELADPFISRRGTRGGYDICEGVREYGLHLPASVKELELQRHDQSRVRIWSSTWAIQYVPESKVCKNAAEPYA